MSSDQEDTSRSGEPWGDPDYSSLVDELRAGRHVEDIAKILKRSSAAVRDRLRWLVPAEVKKELHGREGIELWLKETLSSAAGGYDWRAVVRENYAADGWRYWTPDEIEVLREAWEQARPMPELASELRASEIQVALCLCRLGLAASVGHVVSRLGATPGGVAEVRARMAADRAAAAVWVLVVDGTGRKVKEFGGERRHVSIHATRDAAEHRLNELRDDAERRQHGPITWSLVQRTVGEDVTGEGEAGEALQNTVTPE